MLRMLPPVEATVFLAACLMFLMPAYLQQGWVNILHSPMHTCFANAGHYILPP